MTTAVDGAAGFLAAEPTDQQFADWDWLAADPSSVDGEWADEAMSAAFREANRAAWTLLRWISEAAHASAGTSERVAARRRAGKVPAASLGWSEGFGASRVELARQVLSRLPRLGREMESGRLEEYKARLFTSTLADLDDEQARAVVDVLVEGAPGWSYQVLREKIESQAKAVDPGWAEARAAAAVARRRVVFGAEPSGAAALRGLDLPLDPAQDSYDRIVALAAVVADRLRALGGEAVPRLLEAEVLMVLTGPDGAGLWDEDVVELVVARYLPDDPDPGSSDPDDPGPADPGPDDSGPDGSGPDGSGPDGSGPDGSGPDDSDSDPGDDRPSDLKASPADSDAAMATPLAILPATPTPTMTAMPATPPMRRRMTPRSTTARATTARATATMSRTPPGRAPMATFRVARTGRQAPGRGRRGGWRRSWSGWRSGSVCAPCWASTGGPG